MDKATIINLIALILIFIIVNVLHYKWDNICEIISDIAIIIIIPLNGFLVHDIIYKICDGIVAEIMSLIIIIIMSIHIGVKIRQP